MRVKKDQDNVLGAYVANVKQELFNTEKNSEMRLTSELFEKFVNGFLDEKTVKDEGSIPVAYFAEAFYKTFPKMVTMNTKGVLLHALVNSGENLEASMLTKDFGISIELVIKGRKWKENPFYVKTGEIKLPEGNSKNCN